MFPVEIYENILQYLDGKTLLAATCVCKQWLQIAKHLEKKRNIWKQCCEEEIPKIDLYALTDKYGLAGEKNWKIIYKNWISWGNLKNRTHTIIKRNNLRGYFTCCKITGSVIVAGNLTGNVTLLSESADIVCDCFNVYHSHVSNLFFLNDTTDGKCDPFKHTHLLIAYESKLILCKNDYGIVELGGLTNVVNYGIYKNYLSYESSEGFVNVMKINFDSDTPFELVTQWRIYRPTTVRALNIWDGKVVMITDSNVLSFRYETGDPVASISTGPILPVRFFMVERYWFFYSEILFTLGNDDFTVITISDDPAKILERKFEISRVFNSNICDVYLHGHVLIISTADGMVYIYVVKHWNEFTLKKYDCRISAHSEPVYVTDIQELEQEQRILLITNVCIIQVFIS